MSQNNEQVMRIALNAIENMSVKSADGLEGTDIERLASAATALRAALAAQAGQSQARWYCIDKSGMATLCADQADALQNAKLAQEMWPHNGPHRAVQLFEHPPAPVDYGKPLAWMNPKDIEFLENYKIGGVVVFLDQERAGQVPLYTHPAPVRQPLSEDRMRSGFSKEEPGHRFRDMTPWQIWRVACNWSAAEILGAAHD
jgi:hypothetical protein